MDPATPDLLATAARGRGAFLLPGFDEFVLGYARPHRASPPEFADRIVPGSNGMFRPTVVTVAGSSAPGTGPAGGQAGRDRDPVHRLRPTTSTAAVPALAAAFP